MSARIPSLTAVLLLAIFWPTPALACSCGGTISTLAAADAPGDFEVWVEHGETIVAPKRVVHAKNGAEVKFQLLIEYSGADR